MGKRIITKYSGYWDIEYLTVSDSIEYLKKLDAPSDAKIIFSNQYDGDTKFQVFWDQEETDEEYQRRISQESRVAWEKGAKERQEYERLKQKFESGNPL